MSALLALSGHGSSAHVCLLLDQSGHAAARAGARRLGLRTTFASRAHAIS